MKNLLAILVLFFAFSLCAQQTDSVKIKASDPTQIYTFVEGYGGFNFIASNNRIPYLDTWELGFRGNWGIKKFRIGVYIPMSNNTGFNRVFDDITVDLGYQIHNNSGFYNATVINAGFVSPSQQNIIFDINPFYDIMVYPNSSSFYTLFVNYVGALKVSEKLSLYPKVEWYQRTRSRESSNYTGNFNEEESSVFVNGLQLAATMSYDFNAKNFIQFTLGWSAENWTGKYGSPERNDYLSGISQKSLTSSIKYQYAFTPAAQAYCKVQYNDLRFEDGVPRMESSGGGLKQLYGLQLGFTYFLH